MRILNQLPVLDLKADNIKHDARNILLISRWFPESTLTQNLKLNQVIEWLARCYGYKSYAALQADISDTKPSIVIDDLSSFLDFETIDDVLFLQAAESYLVTPKDTYKDKLPVYIEPSCLLRYAIKNYQHFCSEFELFYKTDMFYNLAVINAIGSLMLRDHVTMDKLGGFEKQIYDDCRNNSFVKKMIRYHDKTEPMGKEDYEWQVFLADKGKWDVLCTQTLDTPLSSSKLELDKAAIAKILKAKSIVSLDVSSLLIGDEGRFTSDRPIYEIHQYGFGNHADAKGFITLYEPDADTNKAKDSLGYGKATVNDTLYLEVEYVDQNNEVQTAKVDWIDTTYSFYVTKKGFNSPLGIEDQCFEEWKNIKKGSVEYELFHFLRRSVIKHYLNHPFILANIYASCGGCFDDEDLKNYKAYKKLENEYGGHQTMRDLLPVMNNAKPFPFPFDSSK